MTYFCKYVTKNRGLSHFIEENTWLLGWEFAFCFLTAKFQRSISFYRQYQSLRKHNAIKGSNNRCLIIVMWTLSFGGGTKAPWDPDTDLKGILISEALLAKSPLLLWHSNQHASFLIPLLGLVLLFKVEWDNIHVHIARSVAAPGLISPLALYAGQTLPLPKSLFCFVFCFVFFSSAPQCHPIPCCYVDGSHRPMDKLVISVPTPSPIRRAIRLVYCRQNQYWTSVGQISHC